MTARELIELLELEHPDQEVVLCTQSKRVMQVLGINVEKSREAGAVALDVDWSVTEGRIKETEEDKLRRERAKLTKEINRLTDERKRQLAAKVRKQSTSKRNKTAQMIDEIIGPVKKGPKPQISRGRGRPPKYKKLDTE